MNRGYKALLLNSRKDDGRDGRREPRSDGREEMRMGGYDLRYERRNNGGNMRMNGDDRMEMNGYNARYEPRNDGYGMNYPREEYEPEDRFRDRRGREHYDNGRYAPMRNAYTEPEYHHYPDTNRIPPIYEQPKDHYYEPAGALPRMGFDMTGEHEQPKIWSSGHTRRNPMYEKYEDLTEEKAKRWVDQMENEDGSRGAHWTMDQVKQVVKQKMLNLDPVQVFLALNMIWSDYYPVAKKYNVNNTDFYLDMAKAFLEDKDAGDHKLEKYFESVVK